ncbi:hypothetical protein BY996DRAFT_6542128 [Phakopsora pachyrhizi]|nr:hypothetical protein BY996DRAFT_6542128 [Phakopsora pachyrhizi]
MSSGQAPVPLTFDLPPANPLSNLKDISRPLEEQTSRRYYIGVLFARSAKEGYYLLKDCETVFEPIRLLLAGCLVLVVSVLNFPIGTALGMSSCNQLGTCHWTFDWSGP